MLLYVKMFKQNLIHYGRWVNQKPTQSEKPHLHCNYGVTSNLEILNLLLFISSASLASHCHHCVLPNKVPVFLELLFSHILVGCLQKALHLVFSIQFLLSQFLFIVDSFSCISIFSCSVLSVHFINMLFIYLLVFINLGLVPFSEAPHVTFPIPSSRNLLAQLKGFC